jgi:hypothetical protein
MMVSMDRSKSLSEPFTGSLTVRGDSTCVLGAAVEVLSPLGPAARERLSGLAVAGPE